MSTYLKRVQLGAILTLVLATSACDQAKTEQIENRPNNVAGTWRMVSAQIDPDGQNLPAYGANPSGLLVFAANMHFVEVLTNSTIPKFASNERGKGTAQENQAAMAGSLGLFGTYTVDETGDFSGNRVAGATFPNWVGSVRTRQELQMVVDGDRMLETFTRPEGTKIVIVWQRVK